MTLNQTQISEKQLLVFKQSWEDLFLPLPLYQTEPLAAQSQLSFVRQSLGKNHKDEYLNDFHCRKKNVIIPLPIYKKLCNMYCPIFYKQSCFFFILTEDIASPEKASFSSWSVTQMKQSWEFGRFFLVTHKYLSRDTGTPPSVFSIYKGFHYM